MIKDKAVALWRRLQVRAMGLRPGVPILVYQMGKVGSSTIVRSIEARGPRRPIFHVHIMTRDKIRAKRASQSRERPHLGRNVWAGRYLLPRIRGAWAQQRVDYVVPVRDPVGRNVSAFFQGLDRYHEDGTRDVRPPVDDQDRQALVETFVSKYDHDWPDTWFREEFRPVTGIDVFSHRFDREAGYTVLENGPHRALVLRLENMRGLSGVMADFLGIDDFEWVDANVAADKPYAEAYDDFRRSLTLPASLLDRCYSSRYARHFYSPDEIAGFRALWSAAPPAGLST